MGNVGVESCSVEFSGSVADRMYVPDHAVEIVAAVADGEELVGGVIHVRFGGCMGRWGDMPIEVIKAFRVFVGEAPRGCRKDLAIISEVCVALGAQRMSATSSAAFAASSVVRVRRGYVNWFGIGMPAWVLSRSFFGLDGERYQWDESV